MTRNAKPSGLAITIPGGLAVGGAASLGVTLAGSALLAKLVDLEQISWNRIGYGVMAVVILSAWVGAATAAGKIKRRRLLCCCLAGCVYYGILVAITALFFGGNYSGAGETALLVICGSMLGVLLCFPVKKPSGITKTKIRNR
ncbi:MAG: TIGR04086 family membrane protein [Oscillospiraceae bacterium]|nr:TIGR04086 family membrane protein [Oscillospiraceae bacterium]